MAQELLNQNKSSVEWFAKESWKLRIRLENKEISIGEYSVTYVELLKQAKKIHENEIENAYIKDRPRGNFEYVTKLLDKAQQYYQKTFGGDE